MAVIATGPVEREVPRPPELTVATATFPEVQVAEAVRSIVLLSVNVPVAVNCWVVPKPMKGADGFTVIETRVAELTVRSVTAEIEPKAAEMLELPLANVVASPLGLIAATPGFEELQFAEEVRS